MRRLRLGAEVALLLAAEYEEIEAETDEYKLRGSYGQVGDSEGPARVVDLVLVNDKDGIHKEEGVVYSCLNAVVDEVDHGIGVHLPLTGSHIIDVEKRELWWNQSSQY